jgi:hypothetical protein
MTVDINHVANLVDGAGANNKIVKDLEPHIKAAKEELADLFLELGVKELTGTAYKACARFTEKYNSINPLLLFNTLEKMGIASRFFDVVKVDMTALKEVRELAPATVDTMKGAAIGTVVAVSFKPL